MLERNVTLIFKAHPADLLFLDHHGRAGDVDLGRGHGGVHHRRLLLLHEQRLRGQLVLKVVVHATAAATAAGSTASSPEVATLVQGSISSLLTSRHGSHSSRPPMIVSRHVDICRGCRGRRRGHCQRRRGQVSPPSLVGFQRDGNLILGDRRR